MNIVARLIAMNVTHYGADTMTTARLLNLMVTDYEMRLEFAPPPRRPDRTRPKGSRP